VTQDFKKLAKKAFDNIFDLVEKKYQDFDIDYEEDNLIIEVNNLTFVLSIHNPMSQIWLSSPISGAHHFELKKENEEYVWMNTRDESIFLFEKLENELKTLL
tara:strand:- start:47 stop:352 length:306 start_codon:yes stop_codon:yes gene_type:complete